MNPIRKPISGLYALTPDTPSLDQIEAGVAACLAGGARIVQYRNKQADAPHRQIALGIGALCRQHNATFIINDDVALAIATNADGVHLGKDDGDIASARRQLGNNKIIGLSCYGDLQRALEAEQQGADYIAFGSMFPSSTKPGAPRATLELLNEAQHRLHIPIVAIGGITLQNAASVIHAGADAIAVINAVFAAPDVRRAAQQFSELFAQSQS